MDNYKKTDLSVSMRDANIYGLLIIVPPMVVVTAVFVSLWGSPSFSFSVGNVWLDVVLLLAIFLLGIILHEMLHAVTWKMAGNIAWSQLEIGFQWKTLTPYAHAKTALRVRAYRLGTAMPGLVLGGLPAVIAFVTGSAGWLAFSLIFIMAAGGDALILWLIRRVHSTHLIEDHPTRAGCFALSPIEDGA